MDFRWGRGQRLRALDPIYGVAIEARRSGTTHEAGIMDAALTIDAEADVRGSLVPMSIARITLMAFDLCHDLRLPTRHGIRIMRRGARRRPSRAFRLFLRGAWRAGEAGALLLR